MIRVIKISPHSSSLRAIVSRLEVCHNTSDMRSEPTENTQKISENLSQANRERTFDLSLSAVIRGSNATGTEFEEKTRLVSISSQKAIFTLKSPLLISSRMHVVLSIPRTLILGKRFYLQIFLDRPFKIESPS